MSKQIDHMFRHGKPCKECNLPQNVGGFHAPYDICIKCEISKLIPEGVKLYDRVKFDKDKK